VQKNRKPVAPSRPVRRFPVAIPEVVSMDVIAYMSDDDLVLRLRSLEEDMSRVFEARMDTTMWEVEIAYIRREQQLRYRRHPIHVAYMNRLSREFMESEIGLPVADLDNSAFTELSR